MNKTYLEHLREGNGPYDPIQFNEEEPWHKESKEKVITGNEAHGYHGEMRSKYGTSGSHSAYNKAHGHVMRNLNISHDEAKHFLDSKSGRNFAGNEHSLSWLGKEHKNWKKTYNPSDYE